MSFSVNLENCKRESLVKILRGKIRKLDTTKYQKNEEMSIEYKNKGNAFFKDKKWPEAAEAYTQATIYAPVDEKGANQQLSFGFANRSAALYHMKRYQESLEDIQLALDCGYPENARDKLLMRRASCLQEMGKTNESNGKSCEEIVPQINCEKVEPFDSLSGRGKGLRAKKRISKGDAVMVEKAFASILSPSKYDLCCYHCLRKISGGRPFPCYKCTQVRFCSFKCARRGWTEYHRVECCHLDMLHISEEFHFSPKMGLRFLLKNGVTKSLSYNRLQGENLPLEGYPGVYSLVEHPEDDQNDYDMPATVVLSFILESHPNDLFTKSTLSLLHERIIKHIRQNQVNGITVTTKNVTRADPIDSELSLLEEEELGCGLFLTLRYANHSCDPNISISYFEGDTVVVEALRDIEAGEELFNSYGVHYKWQLLSKRQKMLKESYFFDCNCSACEKQLQPTNKALLCPKCKGPVVTDGMSVCAKCKMSNHLNMQRIVPDAEACVKLMSLGSKCLEDEGGKDCRGETRMDKDVEEEEEVPFEMAEKLFLKAFQMLSGIMFKNNHQLAKVADKLTYCYKKLGRFEEATNFAGKHLNIMKADHSDNDLKVFNGLCKLIDCQHQLLLQSKKKKAADERKLIKLGKELDQSLQQLGESIAHVVPPSSSVAAFYRNQLSLFRGSIPL